MNDLKQLKDPIYGYIAIPSDIMNKIVDTAEFQRLRNIVQTSYAPLYSSAVHNRFIHSLGVYHLGSIVANNLKDKFRYKSEIQDFDRLIRVFEIACLLHDLGHAPFSHTGEEYYLEDGKRDSLHNLIIELTQDEDLQKEIVSKSYKAAAHELMSVIVALKDFDFIFNSYFERSFFARCILGYQYCIKKDSQHSFMNCVISLLNSAVIDVDKLDYLIRDAYITGFDTVSIDYERLLRSINFVKSDNEYLIVYSKSAISVIENVVYAHDAERKWIQNHPVVQYEAYLIKSAIDALKEKYSEINIFSYDALTVGGIEIFDNYKLSLLCDADIVFLMKNLENEFVKEYFQRKNRRHPLWKSESEYKAIFTKEAFGDGIFEKVETTLDALCKYLNYVCKSQKINQKALDACNEDLRKIKDIAEKNPQNRTKYDVAILEKQKYVKWLEIFKQFANSQQIEFDFLILNANQFNSGFTKEAFGNIQIEFDFLSKPCLFKDVTNVLKASKSVREKFFYLYYRKSNDKNVDICQLALLIGQTALSEVLETR